jgi:hypothetical protein
MNGTIRSPQPIMNALAYTNTNPHPARPDSAGHTKRLAAATTPGAVEAANSKRRAARIDLLRGPHVGEFRRWRNRILGGQPP